MDFLLSSDQRTRYQGFQDFVSREVEPFAGGWDNAELVPREIRERVGRAGFLGSSIPAEFGGQGLDTVTFGLLNEAFGRGSPALTDLLTVQAMVAMTLVKWGTPAQKTCWLPSLAQGQVIAAYALTEPGGGSDLQSLKTELKDQAGGAALLLNGVKTWISYGQNADLFLVFGSLEGKSTACLVPRASAGLTITPIKGMMGFRGAGLAQINFDNVEVPVTNLIGKPGVALPYIVPVGLHFGRISTACSALGLLRGCFESSATFAANRRVAAGTVGDLGMIRSILARIGTDFQAAQLLCYAACRAVDERLPEAIVRAVTAKYFTTQCAARAAADAIQIQGASGCQEKAVVSRYYRDAKIMEIIEGTSQIHEEILGRTFVQAATKLRPHFGEASDHPDKS